MDYLFLIGFAGALIAGIFAVLQAKKVMSFSEGTERMQKLAASIREGANAYLKQQYSTVFKVFVVVFAVLLIDTHLFPVLRMTSHRCIDRSFIVFQHPVHDCLIAPCDAVFL